MKMPLIGVNHRAGFAIAQPAGHAITGMNIAR
jgi:hypothetical protein